MISMHKNSQSCQFCCFSHVSFTLPVMLVFLRQLYHFPISVTISPFQSCQFRYSCRVSYHIPIISYQSYQFHRCSRVNSAVLVMPILSFLSYQLCRSSRLSFVIPAVSVVLFFQSHCSSRICHQSCQFDSMQIHFEPFKPFFLSTFFFFFLFNQKGIASYS